MCVCNLCLDVGDVLMEEGLYRVKSCPGIVDQIKDDNKQLRQQGSVHVELQLNGIRLRVGRNRSCHIQQRYSCGTLDHKSTELITDSSHSSNPSLNRNSFSFIQVS